MNPFFCSSWSAPGGAIKIDAICAHVLRGMVVENARQIQLRASRPALAARTALNGICMHGLQIIVLSYKRQYCSMIAS